MTGYSAKSLRDKLGIKSGFSVVLINTPLYYIHDIGELDDVMLYPTPKSNHDFIHLFVKERKELEKFLPQLQKSLKPAGSIWVSWPKKASKVPTDITEDTIREVCLPKGLVDVKVAAIDETWSGLKLVIRKENR